MDEIDRFVAWVISLWPLILQYALALAAGAVITLVVWACLCVLWDVLRRRRHP